MRILITVSESPYLVSDDQVLVLSEDILEINCCLKYTLAAKKNIHVDPQKMILPCAVSTQYPVFGRGEVAAKPILIFHLRFLLEVFSFYSIFRLEEAILSRIIFYLKVTEILNLQYEKYFSKQKGSRFPFFGGQYSRLSAFLKLL